MNFRGNHQHFTADIAKKVEEIEFKKYKFAKNISITNPIIKLKTKRDEGTT